MSHFHRPSLRKDTFQAPQHVGPLPEVNRRTGSNLAMSFNQRNSDIHLNDFPTASHSSLENREESHFSNAAGRYADYANRIHSIHRNRLYNTNSGNLRQAYEARSGEIDRKTMGRNIEKGGMGEILENHANLIVSKMEQDPTLMEDSITAEQLRKEALREMPQCLTIKRSVKGKLLKSVKHKPKHIGCFKLFKYQISMGCTNLKQNIKELAYSFELWYSPLKKIEGNFGTGVASFFKFLRWLFLLNFVIAVLSISFIVIPQLVFSKTKNLTHSHVDVDIGDIFTGEGCLTDTVMFYGFYSNTSVSLLSLTYSMPEAYFFTMFCIYVACFLILSYSVAVSYRRSFIETEGGLKNVFAHKIFCGWDSNIANKEAAELKSRAIYNELKELISASLQEKKRYSCVDRFRTMLIRGLINILFVLLVALIGYCLWSMQHHGSIVIAIVVNVVITVLPMVFALVVKFEEYKNPKSMLYLNLARTFILGFVIIGVLVVYWLKNSSDNECWETSLGQEVYRLILFDFFFSVLLSAVVDFCQYWIYHCIYKESLEFDIARNTMQIMYNQTLFWVGFFFSPILSVVVVIKLFIAWYVKLFVALKLCRASVKSWRAAQTSTWFLVMAFMSLLLIEGTFGYLFASIKTSKTCGPFSNYNYIFEIVTEGIFHLKANNGVWSVLLYITKPGVIAMILIGLSVAVYFVRAKALAHRELVRRYREFLVWEAKDKEFLLQYISKITKGQWQYKLHESREADPVMSAPNLKSYMATDIGDNSIYSGPTSSINLISSISGDLSSSTSLKSDDRQPYSQYKKYS